MRLTKKSDRDYTGYEPVEELVKKNNASPIIGKLGQLEDIEEKMKMPIDKFFKALGCKEVVCWEYWEDKPRELIGGIVINVSGCVTDKDTFGFDIQTSKGNSYTYWSYDYGKTWALTREELEK